MRHTARARPSPFSAALEFSPVKFERVVLSSCRALLSYFDLEHIAHVHPRSFGEARLVTTHGNSVVWDLISPRRFGVRLRNRIVQEYVPPDQVRSRVEKGLLRGVRVVTRFESTGDHETIVDETYHVPLPGWPWLVRLVRRWFLRKVDDVWEEDFRVGMCHGGWPGLPGGG